MGVKIETTAYFSLLPIASYNAVFNFVNTNRNFGKTWGLQIRAWTRAYKYGKKTLLIRRFKKEVREQAKKLFSSADLCKKLRGFVPYDKKTDSGNFKRIGNVFYIRKNGRWDWFLQIAALSDSNALRSADDVNLDTIVFDEYTTTPRKYAQYRGDEVTDFIDVFISMKREHMVRCFFFGNRESLSNPYFRYFGIPEMPPSYQGIRTYKKHSIAVQYVNNKQKNESEYDKAVFNALNGTKYGAYLYESQYKSNAAFKRAKTPKNATEYISLNWRDTPMTISFFDGFYYVKRGVRANANVYTDEIKNKYTNEFKLIRAQRPLFAAFANAVSLNIVRYDNAATYEAIQPFYKWLSID